MDELKILLWIVIGLVYFFVRRKRSAQPVQPPQRSGDPDTQEAAPDKPMTFEELLREIEGMKKPEEPAVPESPHYDRPPVRKVAAYEEELVPRKQIEDVNYDYRDQDKIYEVYEEAKKQAFLRPSLEETVKLKDTIVRFNQFKGYEHTNRRNLAEEYFNELKQPQGFKKAFVLSEILKRRF